MVFYRIPFPSNSFRLDSNTWTWFELISYCPYSLDWDLALLSKGFKITSLTSAGSGTLNSSIRAKLPRFQPWTPEIALSNAKEETVHALYSQADLDKTATLATRQQVSTRLFRCCLHISIVHAHITTSNRRSMPLFRALILERNSRNYRLFWSSIMRVDKGSDLAHRMNGPNLLTFLSVS